MCNRPVALPPGLPFVMGGMLTSCSMLCSICKNPTLRRKLDADHRSGQFTGLDIAKKYKLAIGVVYNHSRKHTPKGEVIASSPPPEVMPTPGPPELPPDATDLQKVDADIKWIEERRGRLVGKAVAEKDLAALTGQLLTARRLRAKIAGGEITPGMYARSAHFQRIWRGIAGALEPYPKAMRAVCEAVLGTTGLREEEL